MFGERCKVNRESFIQYLQYRVLLLLIVREELLACLYSTCIFMDRLM